jgi:hypothetical protein
MPSLAPSNLHFHMEVPQAGISFVATARDLQGKVRTRWEPDMMWW